MLARIIVGIIILAFAIAALVVPARGAEPRCRELPPLRNPCDLVDCNRPDTRKIA